MNRLKKILRPAWGIIVLVFIAAYIYKKRQIIFENMVYLSFPLMLAAFFFLFVFKMGMIMNMKNAASHYNVFLSWPVAYRMYTSTQLAKYIPGSIWQFVSRISQLKNKNTPGKNIRDSLIAEHFWLLSSSFLLGAVFIVATMDATMLPEFIDEIFHSYSFVIILSSLAISVIAALILVKNRKRFVRFLPSINIYLLLMLVWLLPGSALWITLLSFNFHMPPILYVIGVYCIAFVIGFAIPFAPAGIGFREAILVAALSPYSGPELAVLLTTINRLLYLLVELIIYFPCLAVDIMAVIKRTSISKS